MAKKHYGKLIAFAAAAGAVTAGISYFLRYRSFHDELDEDFHDFEEDLGERETSGKDGDGKEGNAPAPRNYVSLTPDRPAEPEKPEETPAGDAAGTEEAPAGDAAGTEEAPDVESCADAKVCADAKEAPATTTIVEDTAE